MSKLKIVTYLRENECINENIKLIVETLLKEYSDLSIVVFVDRDRTDLGAQLPISITAINLSGTKYKRIKKLLETETNSILLSIDNDTTVIPDALLSFVRNFISDNNDIGWARIKAHKTHTFIGRQVAVDKLLSHTVIRPFLWKIGIGISIPGQLFLLKSDSFSNRLLNVDTYLDDLALGIFANLHISNLKILMSNKVIGFEMPKTSFKDLCIQRKRWAKGFYTIWKGIQNKKEKKLVMIHGIAYHFLWILQWLLIFMFAIVRWPCAIFYIILSSYLISRKDLRFILDTMVYQFFFTIFHIVWITNLLKGDKNENNA